MDYKDTLAAEVQTWLIPDETKRREKFRRERIRHYKLIKDLLLDKLGTEEMSILEVGGGPMPVSDLLRFRKRVVIDPLADEYKKVLPCPDHVALAIEKCEPRPMYDLVISTNALDHVEQPALALEIMAECLNTGGYLAIACAENNALTHPHPAHKHNITADWVHRRVDCSYETVWELTYAKDGYRYGWVEYEGRRGQPAFAILLRKCTGYT
jgi:SAM-dependent methyltransferase